jgi:SAM-dependent methyltransferase
MQRAAAALEQALMSLQTDLADEESVRVNSDAASPAAEKGTEPARATLLQIGFGFAAAQSLSVAAELGIADLLAAGPQTIEALATATRTDPGALRRVLRLLAAQGIFSEEESGRFAQTHLSDALRADAPGSPRDFLRMIGREPFLAWGRLLDAVRTGRPSFDLVFGAPRFDWLGQNPEAAALFQAAMVALGGDVVDPIATAYEFGDLGVVVDVGGGHGRLLSAILARYPGVDGILFDLPGGIAAAEAGLGGPLPRCKLVAGDFFESVPEGANAYLMKKVLHDWSDDDAVRILANCRRAMAPGGRVLVAETVVPPGNAPDPIKVMDVNMLVVTGGRERTADEFAALFERAGLRAGRVVPTGARVSILEAFAA